jgi:hypothetical protein
MRSRLPGVVLLGFVGVAASLAADDPSPSTFPSPPPGAFAGRLAFSDTIIFDYDRDGTPDRVQFWIELEGQQAMGEPGDPGARPESGSVRYWVADLERKRRVDDWLLGFNMSEGFPVAGEPYPITDISITDRTVRFELRGSRWTITDSGDTWEQDSIEVETGGRKRQGRFYGGDIKVTPGPPGAARPAKIETGTAPIAPPVVSKPAQVAKVAPQPSQDAADTAQVAPVTPVVLAPADIKANRKCINCHAEAAGTIAAHGGTHGELECVECHNKHPRDVKAAKPLCLNCHNSHHESITMRMCSSCHSSHDVTRIQYGIQVPDVQCAACHRRSATRLRESGTRHVGLQCVICHRGYHAVVPSCVDCHGGPHAQRIMSKPDRCARCHDSAHQTKTDR